MNQSETTMALPFCKVEFQKIGHHLITLDLVKPSEKSCDQLLFQIGNATSTMPHFEGWGTFFLQNQTLLETLPAYSTAGTCARFYTYLSEITAKSNIDAPFYSYSKIVVNNQFHFLVNTETQTQKNLNYLFQKGVNNKDKTVLG